MKTLKSIFLAMILFSFGFSTCQNEELNAANDEIQLRECSLPEGLIAYKEFENQESAIKKVDYEYNGTKNIFYHIGLLRDVPTGYLGACNLPEDFTQDGLKVKFSGTVYVPKEIDVMNLSSVPVKLTKLEKITDNQKP
jgi:hypothetical protein